MWSEQYAPWKLVFVIKKPSCGGWGLMAGDICRMLCTFDLAFSVLLHYDIVLHAHRTEYKGLTKESNKESTSFLSLIAFLLIPSSAGRGPQPLSRLRSRINHSGWLPQVVHNYELHAPLYQRKPVSRAAYLHSSHESFSCLDSSCYNARFIALQELWKCTATFCSL